MKITLVGLGVGKGALSLNALTAIKSASKVICKTQLTESAKIFAEQKVQVTYLDDIFKSSKNFDTLCKKLAKRVLDEAKQSDLVYCVDGSVFDDNSCAIILGKKKEVSVIDGISHSLNAISKTTMRGGYTALSAYRPEQFNASVLRPFILYDIDNNYVAGEWKLRLCSAFGDETDALLYMGDRVNKIQLYELDHFTGYDYTTVLLIDDAHFLQKQRFNHEDLYKIINALRCENGCPWDREQTPKSITKDTLEECYEFIDAIKKEDTDGIIEECGDMYLQLAFQTVFGEETGEFDRNDVLSGICSKLISRHTHVFGNDSVDTGNEALTLWEKNKGKEKGFTTASEYVNSVPDAFPACMHAQKVQKRAGKYGFDFSDKQQVFEKIVEECNEIKLAEKVGSEKVFEEIGDLLFTAVNLARLYGVSAEDALKQSIEKFKTRFNLLEQAILNDKKDMTKLSEKELDKYYNEIKKS